jgi:hypothetical protein
MEFVIVTDVETSNLIQISYPVGNCEIYGLVTWPFFITGSIGTPVSLGFIEKKAIKRTLNKLAPRSALRREQRELLQSHHFGTDRTREERH